MTDKKIHTLFLSYDGLCDPLGRSQVLPYLLGIATNGNYQVHVISAEKPGVNHAEVKDICDNAGIRWYPVEFRSRIKGISAAANLNRITKKARYITKQFPIKLIHARSLPMAIIANRVAKKIKARVVFDMRGFWVNERVEGKIWNIKNPIYYYLYKKMLRAEKQLLKNSGAVITLTQVAKQHIVSFGSVAEEKITVIPCAVDLQLFDAEVFHPLISSLRKQNGFTDDDLVFTYSGSLGTWYMLNEMMAFFRIVKNHHVNAKFLIITKDQHLTSQSLEEKYALPAGSMVIKSGSRNAMPGLLACSNFALFFIRPTFAKKGSSPTKLAEFLALGIPVISNTGIGDMDQQFAGNKLGFLINDFNTAEYNRVAAQLTPISQHSSTNRIAYAHQQYSLQAAVNSYIEVYNRLL